MCKQMARAQAPTKSEKEGQSRRREGRGEPTDRNTDALLVAWFFFFGKEEEGGEEGVVVAVVRTRDL